MYILKDKNNKYFEAYDFGVVFTTNRLIYAKKFYYDNDAEMFNKMYLYNKFNLEEIK